MLNDVRVGLRLLWKDKAFTMTAALTLAVCIGANTALFSVVEHVLLRPLPFPDADRIVLIANQYPGAGVDIGGASSAPDYYDRLREPMCSPNRPCTTRAAPASIRTAPRRASGC